MGSKVIFLDEPSSGMDITSRRNLWEILKRQSDNKIIILTTHYMEEAEALSDRIAIMKDGKLLICDTADKIKQMAKTDSFEEAFVRIVKGVKQ